MAGRTTRSRSPRRVATGKQCFLFVGNPGTGKSALMNGTVGEPIFKSKMSTNGTGVTYKLDVKEIPDLGVFMDTPGLADEKLQKQAAEAITKALKQEGFYRIFFVMTLEAGRVRPDDKTTMKLILEAAPTITDYSIIVNKVSKNFVKDVVQMPENLRVWTATLLTGLPKVTSTVHFMRYKEDLDDETDAKYTAPQDVIDFIKGAPGMVIRSSDVKAVQTDQFKALSENYKKTMEKLREDKVAMQKELDDQKVAMKAAMDRANEAAKQTREKAAQDLARMEKRMGEAAKQTQEKAAQDLARMEKRMGDAEQRAEEARRQAASSSRGGGSVLGMIGEAMGNLFGL